MAGADVAEQLGVGAADGVGVIDVGHQVASAHQVGQRRTNVAQRGLDSAQNEQRLPVRIADGHGLAVGTGSGGTGNEYQVSRAHGARIPVALFPWCS